LNSALGFKLGLKPWKSYEFGQGRWRDGFRRVL
jgi:hypothetical protein